MRTHRKNVAAERATRTETACCTLSNSTSGWLSIKLLRDAMKDSAALLKVLPSMGMRIRMGVFLVDMKVKGRLGRDGAQVSA